MSQKLARITIDDAPPRRRRVARVIVLGVALLFSPLLYEVTTLGVARWRSLYGTVPYVETPVLDALVGVLGEARHDVESRVRPVFSTLPWKTSTVIPLIGVWTALAALLLRSGHRS
jgi:hypothetical protein